MFSRRSLPGREYVTRAGSGRARYPAFKRVLRIYHGEFPERQGYKAYTPRAFSQNQSGLLNSETAFISVHMTLKKGKP